MRKLLTAFTTILIGLCLQGCWPVQRAEHTEPTTEKVTVRAENISWHTVDVEAYSTSGELVAELYQLTSFSTETFGIQYSSVQASGRVGFLIDWIGGQDTIRPVHVFPGVVVEILIKNHGLSAVNDVHKGQ